MKTVQRLCSIIILTIFLLPAANAQRPHGPPPEAFSACQDKRENDSCSFQAPHGTVSGACRNMLEPDLVCVPEHRQPAFGPDTSGPVGHSPGISRQSIASTNPSAQATESRIPDTGQGSCFDNSKLIECPASGSPFYGQDAQYLGSASSYRNNGNGTVADLTTGLTWQQAHNEKRLSWQAANQACAALDLGGYKDWRLPTIKELFSLADFRGSTGQQPFIDPIFEIREPSADILNNDRFAPTHRTDMMGQTWSSTIYSGDHWGRPGVKGAFFFNFLDGRIKQAPVQGKMGLFYRCVRGDRWGENQFIANADGTVTDQLSGLTWQQQDDGKVRDWENALAYCADLSLAGHTDWRLPNVKELQSIVDYSRHDPALDPHYFSQSDPTGWFWSSTTHGENFRFANYICFGKCIAVDGTDVHGAGAQRSDPKTGDPNEFIHGLGGQKDQVRIYNYARCVR